MTRRRSWTEAFWLFDGSPSNKDAQIHTYHHGMCIGICVLHCQWSTLQALSDPPTGTTSRPSSFSILWWDKTCNQLAISEARVLHSCPASVACQTPVSKRETGPLVMFSGCSLEQLWFILVRLLAMASALQASLRKALPSVPASYNVIKVARERFRMVCSERSVSRSAWFLPSANFPELKSLKLALNETMATRKARQTFSLETFTDSLNYSLGDHQRQFTGNKGWLPPRSIWITVLNHSISLLLVLSIWSSLK